MMKQVIAAHSAELRRKTKYIYFMSICFFSAKEMIGLTNDRYVNNQVKKQCDL